MTELICTDHLAEGDCPYELLAAPVLTDRGLPALYCAIASAEPIPVGTGW
ncbi:MAG TPA: hypothetical protein VFO69_09490 [Allosphingosinicella sp.]|nr:hypothetical protein [Allosphingosinicella sp.]